jgi:rhodanese-related sulfurtransferase
MFNLLKSLVRRPGQSISPAAYQAEFIATQKPHVLIDVRSPEEFKSGHIPGAKNIDLRVLAQRLDAVPKDKPVVLYCRSGNRSGQAASLLQQAGYAEIFNLGGIGDWQSAGYPIK